ncbi:hypothetical protein ZWY2020_004294 [Hordeum vulgare]|nr:hypothetical protein ZWY2020_004294 [Hordeum vulgare]
MASRGEAKESHEWSKQKRLESSGGMLAQAAGMASPLAGMASPPATITAADTRTPSTSDHLGKTASRCLQGKCTPLVIGMEAARKAVSGFMVVGCLLSPFHVNPHAIIDELRATTWKNQGVVTVQEVASDDGRRDNFIFAEFDGKGNPVEVDLGVMAIWAQVHDLTFELKTESMGRTLGDQLGEVLEVSHYNHIIV